MILVPPSSEFTVNTSGATSVARPCVATNGTDQFVVVWEASPASNLGVLGAVFSKGPDDASLTQVPPLTDHVVAVSVSGAQDQPHVDANVRKKFCVTWVDRTGGTPVIKFSLYDEDFLTAIATDVVVAGSPQMQFSPKVAFSNLDIDLFAIVWVEEQPDFKNIVRASVWSCFDDSGPIVPGLTHIATFDITDPGPLEPSSIDPQVAVNELTGEFLVTWTSLLEPTGVDIIKGQKFDRDGKIGPTFVVSDPTVDATASRISIRPKTMEFVITWLQEDPSVSTGLTFNVFWRRMRMEPPASSPDSIIDPPPGIQEVPGAKAAANGDIDLYGDGSFVISWINDGSKEILATQYGWEDVPVPPTDSNAPVVVSPPSTDPHGGIPVNLVTTVNIPDASITGTRNVLVAVNADIGMASVTARCVPVVDRLFISDFIYFVTPAIYGIDAVGFDAIPMDLMRTMFFEEQGSTPPSNPPDPPAGDQPLDTFLNGEDVVLIGGPIHNSMASDLLGQATLKAEISDTEAVEIFFSTTGNGILFGAMSPQLFVKNQNNPTGVFMLERQDMGPTIVDYAVIFQIAGSTNKLIFVAGIRDHGTAVASHVLDNVRRNDSSTVLEWQEMLNTQKAVIVRFEIASGDNTATPSAILAALTTSDVQLIPAQSIAGNNP